MASRVGRVLQDRTNIVDSSSGASVGWKSGVSKTPKNGGLHGGGRTPLGDLSNSLKPSANWGAPSKFSFVESENPAVAGKKKGQDGARKRRALSDISNSGKPPVNETRKNNLNTKLNIVAEEPEGLDVSQEGFLHNHEECIKANAGAVNLNQFLKTLGLDHGLFKELEILRAYPGGAKVEALDIPLLPEEPEEMQTETLYWKKNNTPSYNLASPPHSPTSPKLRFDFDGPSFEMIESPKALAFPIV